MQHVRVDRYVHGSPEAVFETYTDHVGWAEWGGLSHASIDSEGDPRRKQILETILAAETGESLARLPLSKAAPTCHGAREKNKALFTTETQRTNKCFSRFARNNPPFSLSLRGSEADPLSSVCFRSD